jgi:accessory gene regulator B
MKYSRFSETIASYFSSQIELDKEKRQIIAYSIEILILDIFGFILILAVGACFGSAIHAAIAGIAGGFLRRLSGGAHLDSPLKCLFFGALVYGLLGFLGRIMVQSFPFDLTFVCIGGLLLSSIIVYVYSPVDSAAKPIKSLALRRKLKHLATVFVLLSFILLLIFGTSSYTFSFALGVFYQTVTLLPLFNRRRCCFENKNNH